MNLENANQALQEYKKQLNKISIHDGEYKMLLSSAAYNFFGKVKKIDRSFLIDYFNSFNKEIFVKDKVQEDAFKYLFLLVIKNTKTYQIFHDFFPNYLKSHSIQSDWLIIRWIKNFIYWLVKPKLILKDSQGAINLLNTIRDIKDRTKKKGIKMHNLYQEIAEFKALAIVVKELSKNMNLHKIYIPINEDKFLEKNHQFFERQLSCLTDKEVKKTLDIDNLNLCIITQKPSIFNENNTYLKKNIDNIVEGIEKRRFLQGTHFQTTSSKVNLNQLTSEFKQLLSLNISQIQFYFQAFNENLAKQNQQFYYGNVSEFYKNLNKLGEILYLDKNLFFHSINQDSSIDYIIDLSGTLDKLSGFAEFLKSIAKEIDPKILGKDILKLSEYILLHLSVIKENLRPYTENIDFIMRSVSYKNSSLNSDSETEFTSEVVSLDSEGEEVDNRFYYGFIEQGCLSYNNVTLEKSLVDSDSESGYSDYTSSQYSNSISLEEEKNNGQSKNNPTPILSSFFGIKNSNFTPKQITNTLGMNHA